MHVSVQIDARAAWRALNAVSGAVQDGTVRGLNSLAFDAMRVARGQETRRLDRPSRFTISGTQVLRAKPTDDEPVAGVHIEDKRAKYLRFQEEGGVETREAAKSARGSGSDALVIPVAEAVKDQLGGAGRNAVKRALRLPRTFKTAKGVFQRDPTGRGIHALLLFTNEVDYRRKPLRFVDDVSAYAAPRIRPVVNDAVDRALRRAVRV